MKTLLVIAALICFGSQAQAAWVGKLNLNSNFSPVMIRELHDGQWLAGVAKGDIWELDQNGVKRAHAGMFQAWNAEQGNPATGLVLGVDLPPGFAAGIASGLPEFFKAGAYMGAAVSLDFFGGYRPQHSNDTHSWIYGVGAKLSISFGTKELQNGL